jgi:hypothetical protein
MGTLADVMGGVNIRIGLIRANAVKKTHSGWLSSVTSESLSIF